MRLIDADEMCNKLQSDFNLLFQQAGIKVKPEDYFVERYAVYMADYFKVIVDGFCEMVKAQPTIEAEPVVHGEWEVRTAFTYMPIDFDEYGNLIEHGYDHYVCRLCGRHVNRLESYCPDYGAKMEE